MSTKFQHGVEDVIAQALIVRGFGTDPTPWASWTPDSQDPPPNSPWPVFTANESAFPDNCITCYMAEPQVDARIQFSGEIVHHWGITVRVRGANRQLCRQKAEDIRIDFNEALYQMQVTLDSAQYLIFAVSRCVPTRPLLEVPDSKRWFQNLNCLAVIQPYPIGG